MNILLINFLFYFFAFYHSKYKSFTNVFVFVMLTYSIIALAGYWTFQTGIYEDTFGKKNIEHLSIIPYVLNFLFVYCICLPLKKINLKQIKVENIPKDKILYAIIYVFLIAYILTFFLNIMSMRNFLELDYDEIYFLNATGELGGIGNVFLDKIYGKFLLFNRVSLPIYNILIFYLLAKNNKQKLLWLFLFGMGLQFIPMVLSANRGGMFFLVMNSVFFFLFFYDYIRKSIKRRIIIFVLVGVGFISAFAIIISYARMGEGATGLEQIYRYFGEPFPNLGFNIWNHNINHPNGARFFPSIADFFDNKTFEGQGRNLRFQFWESYVGIPMLNFKTFFGDLYIEFGVFGSFVLLICYLWFVKKILINRVHTIFSISLLFLPYKYAIFSIFGNFIDERNILDLSIQVLVIWIIHISLKLTKSHKFSSSFNLSIQK